MKIKIVINVLCLTFTSILVSGYNNQEPQSTNSIKCILKGEVIDRPQSSQILLMKSGENPRVNGVLIPINNGRFEYELTCSHEELYQLIFYDEVQRGEWGIVRFISEESVVNFKLHPIDKIDKNIIDGGKLTKEYIDYVHEFGEIAYESRLNWQLQYIREHPNIVGYSILVLSTRLAISDKNDISSHSVMYEAIFAPKYPDHPYTERMINMFTDSSLKPGVQFIDFTTVDINGIPVKLSERIAGKPAVLHLWASWCGPCRQKGMELISVYEEFRDKGFIVIGVARERDSSEAAVAAIKSDKYPWENLVELNDAEQIWIKYGIGGAAGSEFLIDEHGTIVAVAPSIDEIRNFLKNKQ
jgi:thiol-disulfide isomerase/thioredoxin